MDSNLIYDVGAYNGDDSAYYLAGGARVLAVEADPALADALRARFRREIADGRYTVLNVGVARTAGVASFFLCPDRPIWNSFDPSMAAREGMRVEEVQIACRPFESILAEFGVPQFLKIDIEGMDHLCVRALPPENPPEFVSFEAENDALALVLHLERLGFQRFRLVNQQAWTSVTVPQAGTLAHVAWSSRQWSRLALRRIPVVHSVLRRARGALVLWRPDRRESSATSAAAWVFSKGSSGPMPTNSSPGWMDLPAFISTWCDVKNGGILESAWFDIHAGRTPMA